MSPFSSDLATPSDEDHRIGVALSTFGATPFGPLSEIPTLRD